jgi:hypothetical protein
LLYTRTSEVYTPFGWHTFVLLFFLTLLSFCLEGWWHVLLLAIYYWRPPNLQTFLKVYWIYIPRCALNWHNQWTLDWFMAGKRSTIWECTGAAVSFSSR